MADWQRNDRELLARILTAEAGNQGPVGMTAAGNVIMNRASTGGYGDGVRGVIMKPGQFSPMNSVTGYAGGEQGQNIDAISPSETAYMVADSLLSGTAGDITKGATHFYNPEISNPSWAQGVEFTRIGDHVFGKADAPRGARSAANTTQRSQPMAMMTQQPQQQEPRGILEMMGIQRRDPNAQGETALPFYQRDQFKDFAGNIALAANQLRQRPDANLPQVIQASRQVRQDEQRANRTVEWLRTQPNSEAFVQMLESGALPAAVLQAYQKAMTPQTAAAQNFATYQQILATQGQEAADSFLAVAGNGGTSIKIDQRATGEFEDAFAKGDAETISEVSAAGMQAIRNSGRIDELDRLLQSAPTGAQGYLKSVAGQYGINTEGLDDIQAATALINSLVPEQRQPGSGPMSDADLELFKQSLPRIINQPGGNAQIISTMRAIADYDAQGAEIVQRLRAGEIDRPMAFQLLQGRTNPLSTFSVQAPTFDNPIDELDSILGGQ